MGYNLRRDLATPAQDLSWPDTKQLN